MRLKPFRLERHFARHEFTAPYLLSPSDCEPLGMAELLALADDEQRALWEGLRLGYTESRGHPRLLEAVAGLYQGLEAGNVLEVVPVEGIFLAMGALLRRRDRVVAMMPSYQALHGVARARRCEVVEWRPAEDWRFDVDEALALMTPGTSMLVVNLPHNPTGATLPRADFTRLLEEADRRGVRVLCDEMYRFLEYDPRDRLPSACEVTGSAITLGGLSKAFGLPGLRTGWLASQDREVLQRMVIWKDYTTLCASAPSEILALIALGAREALLERTRAILQANLAHLDRFLAERPHQVSWVRPRAGPVGFPRLEVGVPVYVLAADVVERRGLMMAPAPLFDYPGNYFRVGFGRRNFPVALEQLGEALDERG